MAKQNKDSGNDTIISDSVVGQRLSGLPKPGTTYIVCEGKQVPITQRLTIGRANSNLVVIDDKLASKEHAVIQKIQKKVYIQDLESTNGTFLNGQKMTPGEYIRIRPSDTIRIGRAELSIFHFK